MSQSIYAEMSQSIYADKIRFVMGDTYTPLELQVIDFALSYLQSNLDDVEEYLDEKNITVSKDFIEFLRGCFKEQN